MGRSVLFSQLARAMRVAKFCDSLRISTREGLERAAETDARRARSRRQFLADMGRGAAAASVLGAAGAVSAGQPRSGGGSGGSDARVAIVGAGLAGLVCADRLQRGGVIATLYDAHADRVGGRCFTLRNFFPGQVAENGGEFIDTLHQTMRKYAREFNLAREDVEHGAAEIFYYFNGQHHSEEAVVDEYRELVARMRPDMQASSGGPTFFEHNDADIELDNTDLATYLDTRAAGLPLIRAALDEAYVAEFGREISEQSCLNLLLFIHLDRRSRFMPFGVFSDERFHLVDGNDGITQGIRGRLTGALEFSHRLERLSLNGAGEYEMQFAGVATPAVADAVVLAIPFTVLRDVDLDASLGLSVDKLRAINELGYGDNAKTMIGFNGRPWLTLHGSNGTSYSDLPNLQTTWETNPSRAGANAIITDYSGGIRGRDLNLTDVQQQVDDFLTDFDTIFPGAKAQATVDGGAYRAHREHWPSNPLTKGSYTCYLPGQFTTIAGLEGQQAGRLYFAGEHADSFYNYQGFMEGACVSGVAAAAAILADIRAGVIP